MAHAGGRPLKFETVEDLQKKIDDYFAATVPAHYTITGLALALDTSRTTLMEYEGRPEFANAVKAAKTRIEYGYELSLRMRGSAGDIFGLKNFGWRDRQETDITTNGKDLPAPILGGISADAIRRNDSTEETPSA